MDLFNSTLGENVTFVQPPFFIISGFFGIPNMKFYHVFLFFCFIVTVLGNILVMIVICFDHNLKTPKYVAVFNLVLTDVGTCTALVPKIIDTFLFDHRYISYINCLSYLFFCYLFVSMQSVNLLILSYDRLVAITFPLHYQMMVTYRSMFAIVSVAWVFTITLVLVAVGLITQLSFCRSLIIQSFFVDYGLILRLACNDYTPAYIVAHLLQVIFLWVPLVFILVTYVFIGYALSKLAAAQDRVKAMKTCSSHLLLVAVYYLPIMVMFSLGLLVPPDARMINLSLAFILHPMLNPIVYVLQTEEVKDSLKKLLKTTRKSVRPLLR